MHCKAALGTGVSASMKWKAPLSFTFGTFAFRALGALALLSTAAGCGMASKEAASAASPPADARIADQAYPRQREESVKKAPVMATLAGSAAPESAPAEPVPAPPPPPRSPPKPEPPAQLQPGTTPAATAESGAKADVAREAPQSRDLVIYTARFTMAVYQVDQGLAVVEKIAKDNGGYLGQKRDREITIRIPRARFEPSLVQIDKIGDVLHREIQAQDVTDEHVDLEIRIKNARAMQRRLTDLLARAGVKDALEIEKELHRVTEELERLEGKMKVMKDQIAFSTITVAFEARGATIQTQRVRLPFPWLGGLNLPSLLSLSEEK